MPITAGLLRPVHALFHAMVTCYADSESRVCRLVNEFMQLAPADMLQDAVELLCGEAVLRMIHTHNGCRVGCMVAAYSSPKERKKLVKAMKGHVLKMCLDEFAYVVLIKMMAVVDDTQLMRKIVIQEIKVRTAVHPLAGRMRSASYKGLAQERKEAGCACPDQEGLRWIAVLFCVSCSGRRVPVPPPPRPIARHVVQEVVMLCFVLWWWWW